MGLEVSLDKVTLLKAAFPLCHANRDSVHSQGQRAGRVDFNFNPTRAIVWEGYRDPAIKSKAGQLLHGNIWQAGADPDALIIGVVFSDARVTYMNTVHIAHPGQREESEIESGLVISTYPIEAESEKKR